MYQDATVKITPLNVQQFQLNNEMEQTMGDGFMNPEDLPPDLIPFIPEYARNHYKKEEPKEPTHYGYDADFALGTFTAQIGSYSAEID